MAYDGCYTLPRDTFGGKTLFWTFNNSGSLNNTLKVKCANLTSASIGVTNILVNITYALDGCYTPLCVMLSGKFTCWSFGNILSTSPFLSNIWHFLSPSIGDTNAWIQMILSLAYLRILYSDTMCVKIWINLKILTPMCTQGRVLWLSQYTANIFQTLVSPTHADPIWIWKYKRRVSYLNIT